MASNLITLADLHVHFINDASGEYDASLEDAIPFDLFCDWVSEAYLQINQRCMIYCKRKLYNIAADDYAFDLPTDILDRMVRAGGISIYDSSGDYSKPELLTPFSEMEAVYGAKMTGAGTVRGPAHYGFPEVIVSGTGEHPQMVVLPAVAETVAEGMVMDYVAHPGRLSRITTPEQLVDGSLLGTVDDGASVTDLEASRHGPFFKEGVEYFDFQGWEYSATNPTRLFVPEVGQFIGLRSASQKLPQVWYRCTDIESETGTSSITVDLPRVRVKLDRAYSGFWKQKNVVGFANPGDIAESYMITEASPLEIRRPGLIRYAPLEYVKYRWALSEEGEAAANPHLLKWTLELARIEEESKRILGGVIRNKVNLATAPGLRL